MANNLYFPAYIKDWDAIRDAVTPEQGWKLFTLCLDYAEDKPMQQESDPVITAFFKLLSGGIDRSKATAETNAQKKRYARYCRACKESEISPLNLEQWIESIDAPIQVATLVHTCEQQPTPVHTCEQQSTPVYNHNPIGIQSESESQSESQSESKADKPPRKHFTPPTLEEVRTYCEERGNNVDPQKVWEYYEAGGWKDQNGKPVRNWKQKIIAVWESKKTAKPSDRLDLSWRNQGRGE